MRYEERVLAFIGILGFTEAVNDTVRCNDCAKTEKCIDCKKIGKYSVSKNKETPYKIDKLYNIAR